MARYKRRKIFRPLRRTSSRSKVNLFGKGQRLKRTEDAGKYLYPETENSYPRTDQIVNMPSLSGAEYIAHLTNAIAGKINQTYITNAEQNSMYGQLLLKNKQIQNILGNYRKLSSIVKTSDKTAGLLSNYMLASDVNPTEKQNLLARVLAVNDSENYSTVNDEYKEIKKQLEGYFFKKRFQQNQKSNLGIRMQQDPYSKLAINGGTTGPGFIDLDGNLKNVQITPQRFI